MTNSKAASSMVTVVGAGFSGLTAAYYLARAGFKVEVIEKESRVGGLISTLETPHGLVETAANGLLNSPDVEDLFSEIGLAMTPTLKDSRRRYIFRAGTLRRWPLGFFASVSVFGFLIRYILFRKSVAPLNQETVRTWGLRVLGRETSDFLLEPALQGVYAGDSSAMSASLIFGRFFGTAHQDKTTAGKRAPKIKGTVAPLGGMGELMLKLRVHLEKLGVQFRLNESFSLSSKIPQHPIVIATSASSAANLLSPLDSEKAAALRAIELLPVGTATIFLKNEAAPIKTGFGCLFPPVEKRAMLGVLMNTFIFPNRSRDSISETWIFGGSHPSSLLSKADKEITDIIREERSRCLGAKGEILTGVVTRWPKALPHYTVELENNLVQLCEPNQNVFLIGNYLGEIGLSRILARAKILALQVSDKGKWNE